jgi:N-acetylglucosaminyldiphosphoundecaprenol N-acetyl-beta-D-mannosaminyltransferase
VTVRRRELLGVPFAMVDYAGAMDVMDELIATRTPGYVCAAAVHVLIEAQRDPLALRALRQATLVVPDGMPLVWAANALGERLSDRVYGPDLMWAYLDRCAHHGHRVFLLGGRDEDPDALAHLEARYAAAFPGLVVAGRSTSPFRPLTAAEEDEQAARIEAAAPDVVGVGLGAPRQEKWMSRMRPRLSAPVLAGVGAAFDFHAGLVPQAPRWMQRRGLEWAYRLGREPQRLWRRYARTNPEFVARFAVQWARSRARAR